MPSKTPSPRELSVLIEQLDQVMAEADRLRRQVTQQLADQRECQRQDLSAAGRKPARTRS